MWSMKINKNTLFQVINVTLSTLMLMSLGACTTTNNDNVQTPPPTSKHVTKKAPLSNKPAKPRSSIKFKRDADRVLLYAEIDANQHMASNLNMVFIYNPKLITSISRLNAQQWFSQRHKLLKKHPKSLSVVASYIQPGEKSHLKPFTKHQKKAAMIVIFSSYRSKGEHKIIIKPEEINYVYFMKNHFIAK